MSTHTGILYKKTHLKGAFHFKSCILLMSPMDQHGKTPHTDDLFLSFLNTLHINALLVLSSTYETFDFHLTLQRIYFVHNLLSVQVMHHGAE